jgi:hypothetical protein
MKSKTLLLIAVLLCLLPGFNSCIWLYGYRGIKERPDSELQKFTQKNLPGQTAFKIDTLAFWEHYKDIGDNQLLHDLYQPIQMMVYDSNHVLKSWEINCYAPGFPNLKWEKYINFDTIPPTPLRANPYLEVLNKNVGFDFIVDLQGSKIALNKDYDYLFIAYYSLGLRRQSKRLLKAMKKYQEKHPELKIEIIGVYTDDALLHFSTKDEGICY